MMLTPAVCNSFSHFLIPIHDIKYCRFIYGSSLIWHTHHAWSA